MKKSSQKLNNALLVTGGTSQTGKFFFEELIKQNYQNKIKCVVRAKSNIDFLVNLRLDIDFCYGSLDDTDFLKKTLKGVQYVLNIAGINFSEKIIKAGNDALVEWYICVHTTGRFSKYKSASSEYIRIEDSLMRNYSNLTIIRPTMIYGGKSDQNIWKLVKFIDKYPIFPVFGSGKNLMQPVYAKDLGIAYYLVLSNKKKTFGKQYNLSGKNELSYISILKHVSRGLNKKIIFIFIPIWLSLIFAYLYNFIFKSRAFISVEQVQRMRENKVFSWKEASIDFGFKPIDFKEGIKIELNEFQKHKESKLS